MNKLSFISFWPQSHQFISFWPIFGQITILSLSFVTFRVSRFRVSHSTHETVKLCLQNTLNMSKMTRVYFGVLHFPLIKDTSSCLHCMAQWLVRVLVRIWSVRTSAFLSSASSSSLQRPKEVVWGEHSLPHLLF